MASVREALGFGVARLRNAGSPSPRLDAELLLAGALEIDRTAVLAHPEAFLGPQQLARYESDLARRATGEPVAYIRGLKEFYGLPLGTDGRALIPRPETETLVELAQRRIEVLLTAEPPRSKTPPLAILDVGTGSGAIAIALAVTLGRAGHADDLRLVASDRSPDALQRAIENAVAHRVADRIAFHQADLLAEELLAEGPFELLLANLPYIPSAELATLPVAASFEPALALDGGGDGLAVIRGLLPGLPPALARGGVALLELGSEQVGALREEVERSLPGWSMELHADLGGRPRVAELHR